MQPLEDPTAATDPVEPIEPEIQAKIAQLDNAKADYITTLRDKILFGLQIYPFMSPTMLHTFIGTAAPTSIWKQQVLKDLLEEGAVIKREITLTSPHDRTQTYTVLHLAKHGKAYLNLIGVLQSIPSEPVTPETSTK